MAEPKGGLAGVLGASSKSKDDDDDGAADMAAAKESAADSIIAAVEQGDRAMLASALADFVSLCKGEDY